MKIRKCPRCGDIPYRYYEHLSPFYNMHYAEKDGTPELDCSENFIGDPTYVEAQCNCGHSWKLRGVLQITDLQNDN